MVSSMVVQCIVFNSVKYVYNYEHYNLQMQ